MNLRLTKLKIRLLYPILLSSLLVTPLTSAQGVDSQETEGVSATEIKIGATFPLSGSEQSYFQASFFSGANAYFEHLNQAGGIFGRKIYLLSGDDQGNPSRAVASTSDLLSRSKIFALFNSSPTTPSHIAVFQTLRNRNIPDFYPTAIYSGFRNVNKYPNLIAMGTSTKQEARVAATFSKDYFPGKSFAWLSNFSDGDIEVDVKNAWSGMGFTVKPFTSDSSTGTIHLSTRYPSLASIKKPLIMGGRLVSYPSRMVVFDPQYLNDTYAIMQLPLSSEKDDEFVRFFEMLNLKYAAGAPFDNAFIEGANSAYVFSQAVAASGPNLTRSGLVSTFRNKGDTFSSATYGKLDFGTGATAGKSTFYIAKYDGSQWIRLGDFYTNELDSNLVTKGQMQRTKLLPNGLPVTASKTLETSITCLKGKSLKIIKGLNPTCPTGYRKK